MKAPIHLLFASLLGLCSTMGQVPSVNRTAVASAKGDAVAFKFSNTRPICVVLIHGITGFPESATTTPRPGTLKHARYYWQPEFVRGLMGVTSDDPVCFSGATLMRPANWETAVCRDAVNSDHLMSATGTPDPANHFYPFLSVMFTHRDGSKPLANQTADAAAQIKSIYQASFGSWPEEKQPQLVLLCHSGGGLVARTICSTLESLGGGTSGSWPVDRPIIARGFSLTERENMNFVRRRTMYITTLSTPHEGAQVAQVANQVGQYIQFVPGIGETDPDAPILAELTPPNMNAYNRNQLHPSKCKRPDGSAIPLYCIGGRAPGGPEYFADPNQHDLDLSTPDGGIRFSKEELEEVRTDRSNRREFEAYGLMKADYATQTIWAAAFGNPLNPASKIAYGLCPADNPNLDIVRTMDVHYGFLNDGSLGAPILNPLNIAIGPRLFYIRNNWTPVMKTSFGISHPSGRFRDRGRTTQGDGIIDCDGFVPINSALGAKLGTNTTNAFDHTTGGSWYRFYRSAADYHNHGSITRSESVGTWIRQNITGCHAVNQVLGFVRTDIAAGPRVSTGPVSTW
jgi:hypothetical protein